MKSTDTIKDGNSAHDEYINHRMGELKDILRKLAESFLKFLFAAHSGGIIAVAGIVKIQASEVDIFSKIALTCFVIGLLATAILLLKMLFRIYVVDKAWQKNSDLWYKGKISWGELNLRDEFLTENDKTEFFLAVISFFIFLAGAASGILAMWV
jgi:hypothetical protein